MTPAEILASRKRLGLTQAGLARVMGYGSAQTVSNLERGVYEIAPPAAKLLHAYLDGYRPADWPQKKPPTRGG